MIITIHVDRKMDRILFVFLSHCLYNKSTSVYTVAIMMMMMMMNNRFSYSFIHNKHFGLNCQNLNEEKKEITMSVRNQ